MKYTSLQANDPQLRQTCQIITRKELKTKTIQDYIENMINFVYNNNQKKKLKTNTKPLTVGLSANQIGINKRISIVDLAIGNKKYNDIHILINPEITWQSKTQLERCEGCVNLPNIWGYVRRSKRIKIKALDRSGNYMQIELTGWPAILLQHEIDHLNGKLFIDHLPNPTQALLVEKTDYLAFKKSPKTWPKHIDVSQLIPKQISDNLILRSL